MKTFTTLLLAAGIAAATAACPNMCSGHGSCTTDDQCRCWKGFEGYDCSQRACPMVEAWALDHHEGAHYYAECANKGICNRATGECACFAGYEGRGCQRSSCPNACSGHGKCRLIADLENVATGNGAANVVGSSWDEVAITSCVCDGGYMGPDCTQRVCPYGDDPMTVCEEGDVEQEQQVSVSVNMLSDANAKIQSNADEMTFRFTSFAGETFYTKNIDTFWGDNAGSGSQANFEKALEGVPNFRIRDVTVSEDSSARGGETQDRTQTYTVTFHGSGSATAYGSSVGNNYGAQNLLQCPHKRRFATGASSWGYTVGCAAKGCQPKFNQIRAVYGVGTDNDCTAGTPTTAAAIDISGTSPTGAIPAVFSQDSVLTCPTGLYCAQGSAEMQGSIRIAFVKGTVPDGVGGSIATVAVYAQGRGNDGGAGFTELFSAAADTCDLTDGTAITTDGGIIADGASGTTHTAMKFMGHLSATTGLDFPSDSATVRRVDVSSIMPDTYVLVPDHATLTAGVLAAKNSYVMDLAFSTVTCADTTDITVGDANQFNNYDIENIECSGRGECDRATGMCSCFEGYYGNNCGAQTILV